MGLFAEAATYHEVLAERFPKSDHAKDAAFNSVLLRTTVGDYDKAIQDGKRYRPAVRLGTRSRRSRLSHGQGARAGKEMAGGRRSLSELCEGHEERRPSRGAYVRLATGAAQNECGSREADDALADAVGLTKQKGVSLGPDGKYAAAHARYMQGERISRPSSRSRSPAT